MLAATYDWLHWYIFLPLHSLPPGVVRTQTQHTRRQSLLAKNFFDMGWISETPSASAHKSSNEKLLLVKSPLGNNPQAGVKAPDRAQTKAWSTRRRQVGLPGQRRKQAGRGQAGSAREKQSGEKRWKVVLEDWKIWRWGGVNLGRKSWGDYWGWASGVRMAECE